MGSERAIQLRPARDARPAEWLVAGIRDFDHTVGSIVPPVFAAYARIFHPAGREVGPRTVDVRWDEVAAHNGRAAHPAMEWGSVTGSWQLADQPPVWDWPPVTGELPGTVAMTVGALLARYAAPDRPWFFGLWQGYGRLTFPGMAATFDLPGRPMFLFEGDLASLTSFAEWAGAGPNLWWPAGREWCVGTDIDLMTTYVGASADCVKALIGDHAIEAREVSVDQLVTWDSDTVNPLPSPP